MVCLFAPAPYSYKKVTEEGRITLIRATVQNKYILGWRDHKGQDHQYILTGKITYGEKLYTPANFLRFALMEDVFCMNWCITRYGNRIVSTTWIGMDL
jgi:hypothetical protein